MCFPVVSYTAVTADNTILTHGGGQCRHKSATFLFPPRLILLALSHHCHYWLPLFRLSHLHIGRSTPKCNWFFLDPFYILPPSFIKLGQKFFHSPIITPLTKAKHIFCIRPVSQIRLKMKWVLPWSILHS